MTKMQMFLAHLSQRLKWAIVIAHRPSSVRPSVNFHIFDFSSETAERNSMKLDRKQDLNVLYQVCVFRADRKNKMAALASDWLRHFRPLLWNCWTEFNETWQEARSQRLLPSLCFSGRSEKQDGRPGLWLAETFSTFPLKPLNRIQRNLTGIKISTPSTKFVFFWPIGKTRWLPWPLIGWDIFDFSSETAKRKVFNETWQEARSQRPLPSLCFSGRSEKQDGCPGLWLDETFSTSPLKLLNGIQRNLTGSKNSTPSTKFMFFGPIGKTRWPPWPLIGWDIFDLSSETAERNSTKLDRKQDLNALYQVCVFRADRKNKMAAMASDWLRHFRPLLWNRWTEFNETWQESRSQRPLPSLCFSGRSEKTRWLPWPLIGWDIFDFSSETAKRKVFNKTWQEARSQSPLPSLCFSGRLEKQDGRPGLWLAETFSTSPLKPLNGIQRNLTGIKILMPSTKFVFFGPIGKTRWPPWPLIGWDIFDFSSETAEQNSTKLDRKQDLKALYQVCVFQFDRKNKMAALASDWLRHFRLLLWNRWTNSTKLDRKQDLKALYQVCVFRADRKNKMAALASDWLRHFRFLCRNCWTEFNETWQEARSQSPLPSLCFSGWSEKQDGRLASDWLRHFRLLLWNCWTEFNETWQEARSQHPLPSLCFLSRSEKQDGPPGLWLAETFSTSPLKPLNRIQRNVIGSKISTPSTKFVFFEPIGKTRWPPWPLIGWDIFDFSSETAEPNSTKLDRKQDLKALYQVCVFRADRKNKMATLASDWLRHFRFLCRNCWTEFNETWQEARSQSPLPSLCFSGWSEKQDGRLASDWLRHFRLLLWNCWTEFNETWQEARSQHPLPSLCFLSRSEKQDGRPGLWLAETYSTSLKKPLNGI